MVWHKERAGLGTSRETNMSLLELQACLSLLRETQNTCGVSTGAIRLSPPSVGDPKHLWCLYRSHTPVSPVCGRPETLVVSLQEPHACLSRPLFFNHYNIQFVLHSGDYIKQNEMGGACSTHCEEYKHTYTHWVLVGKPKGKGPL